MRLRDGCDSLGGHLLARFGCDRHRRLEELAAEVGEQSGGGRRVLDAAPSPCRPVEHGPDEAEAAALAGEPADDLDPPAGLPEGPLDMKLEWRILDQCSFGKRR